MLQLATLGPRIHCRELDDTDGDRRTHAEVLINTYNRELERMRMTASANGLFVTDEGTDSIDGNVPH